MREGKPQDDEEISFAVLRGAFSVQPAFRARDRDGCRGALLRGLAVCFGFFR